MNADDLKLRFSQFIDVLNKGDLEVLHEFLASNLLCHGLSIAQGADGYINFQKQLRVGLPDFHINTEDIIVEGSKIASRGIISGTNEGDFFGIKATGKSVTIPFIEIWKIEGDKFSENWIILDMAYLFQQLHLLPQ